MDKYGLIGYPLKHSFSQKFFTEKFERENIDALYVKYEMPQIAEIPELLCKTENLRGLNVTIPYKEQVMKYLDRLSPQAEEVGAVNVIKITTENGRLILGGYNTDVIGFQESISPLLDKAKHKQALVLGTGGASKAVVCALRRLGLNTVYVSRTKRDGMLTYSKLTPEIMNEYTLIVNASPLGTFPKVDEAPDIPYELITPNHLLYDLVYNPEETKFLRLGKEQGATIKNGLEMLELQALAAWKIWNEI